MHSLLSARWSQLQSLPEPSRTEALRVLQAEIQETLTEEEAAEALHFWPLFARPNQLPPDGDWRVWYVGSGRGFGKTKLAAEWVRDNMKTMPGSRGIIIARTYADVLKTCIEGESGLLSCFSPEERRDVSFNINTLEVRYRDSIVQGFTSERPDSLRGPQAHYLWGDELAAWMKSRQAWAQVPFIVRLPWRDEPKRAGRVLVTTTPRPVKEIRELLKQPTTHITRGSSFENWANLNELTRAELSKLRGTRIGRQELEGEVLEDTPGALWTRALVERQTVIHAPDMVRIVVAVDPAVTATETSDMTGIVAVGRGRNGKRYGLADRSLRGLPHQWANAAIDLWEELEADAIVAEANQGGDMVRAVIAQAAKERDVQVRIRLVHASRGKHTRAEPIATAFETGDFFLVAGMMALEDQLCTWVPGEPSPDRLDALVWGGSEVAQGGGRITSHVEDAPRHGLSGDAL